MSRVAPAWAWLALIAILLFDVWLRGHTIGPTIRDHWGIAPWPVVRGEAEPLDCDEAAYAYIGRRLVAGDVLYRDLTENKPPGGYWLYALAVALGGATETSIRLMPIPIVLATIALVWWIGLRLAGPGAACIAGLIHAVASTDPYLFGNGANLEHAINLFATGSLALMIAARGRRAIIAAGACLGAACLVKQVAILHLAVYGTWLVFRSEEIDPQMTQRIADEYYQKNFHLRSSASSADRFSFRSRFADLAALFVGFAVVWVISISILIARGAGPSAFEDIVRYGGALATDTPPDPKAPPFLIRWITGNPDPEGVLPWPFGRTAGRAWWAAGTWPLWLAAIPAIGWLMVGKPGAGRRLVAAWTVSAWVQVALPRLFWQHYYLLPVPGLAVAVAVLLADAVRRTRAGQGGRRGRWGAIALAIGSALGWTGVIQVRDYLLVAPEQLTARYKGGAQWIALRAIGRELGRRSRLWERPRLYLWGYQSPLLFYSGLDSVTPHFFADPLLEAFAGSDHPLIRPRVARIMRDLRAQRPGLVFAGYRPFPELLAYLRRNYLRSRLEVGGIRLPRTPDGQGLWVDRDHFAGFEAGPLRSPRAAGS